VKNDSSVDGKSAALAAARPARIMRAEWRTHKSSNCYPGKGATSLETANVPKMQTCLERCEGNKGCAGVTVPNPFLQRRSQERHGHFECHLRSDINVDRCKRDRRYDTITRLPAAER
jgi:hypothetical protein